MVFFFILTIGIVVFSLLAIRLSRLPHEGRRVLFVVTMFWSMWPLASKFILLEPMKVSKIDWLTWMFVACLPIFTALSFLVMRNRRGFFNRLRDGFMILDIRHYILLSFICCIPFLYVIPRTAALYLQYGEQARSLLFKESSLIFPNLYLAELHALLISPFLFVLVVCFVGLWICKRQTIYLYFALILTALDVLSRLGRMPIYELVLVVFVSVLIFRGDLISKVRTILNFRTILVGFVCVVTALGLTMTILDKRFEGHSLSISGVAEMLVGSQVFGYKLLTEEVEGRAPSSDFVGKGYGRATFGSFNRFFNLLIRRISPNHVSFVRVLTLIHDERIPIGHKDDGQVRMGNAYFTIIGSFVVDFGVAGPLFGAMVFGFLIAFFCAKLTQTRQFHWYLSLVWVCFFLVRGAMNSPLHGYVFWFGLLMIVFSGLLVKAFSCTPIKPQINRMR